MRAYVTYVIFLGAYTSSVERMCVIPQRDRLLAWAR